MASEEKGASSEEAAAEAPAPAKRKTGLLAGVAVGALLLGGGAGALVVGPKLAAHRTPPAAAPAEAASDTATGGGKIFKLENLIVNPAGTEGRRFLMATVAFEVGDDKIQKTLESHDIQVRDAVTSALESQTMEMLTRPGARDSLKQRLAEVVAPMAGPGARIRVYLPQFVIQ
jgi:flagellar FliL protein